MKSKVVTLAIVEIGLVFFAICGPVFASTPASLLSWPEVIAYFSQSLILSLCFVLSFYYNDLYNLRVVRNFVEFSARLLPALGVAFLAVAFLYKLFPTVAKSERPLFAAFLNSLLAAGLLLLLRGIFYSLLKARRFAERVLILGTSSLAWKVASEIEAAPHLGYAIVGLVDDRRASMGDTSSRSPYPLFGPLDGLEKIIAELRPERIIVALTERRGRLPVRDLLNARMVGVTIEDGVAVHERLSGKLAIESLTPSYLIFARDFEHPRWQVALRRAVSLTVAAVGLILTAPLMVLIAVAIKLDSAGPVFFVQDRAGLEGRIFHLVKFRTMHTAATGEGELVWNRDVNSRVTRVGKWLRNRRLDELPQFINILRGDMDLVGPRPEMACNIKTMTEQIPYYALRMVVRPGLTGWAQVKYGYSVSHEDVAEKMRYDLYYIKHMSPWFDLRILLDTVKIIFSNRLPAGRHGGSYVGPRVEENAGGTAAAGAVEGNSLVAKKPAGREGERVYET